MASLLRSSSILFSLLLLFLFFFFHPSSARLSVSVKATKIVVNRICSQTLNPSLCFQILNSDPRTAWADLNQLGTVSISLANANATHTLSIIESLLKTNPDQGLKDDLLLCFQNYCNAIDDLQRAADYMGSHHYDLVKDVAFNAQMNAYNCENAFRQRSTNSFLLTDLNQNLEELCSIVMAISDLIP